jgi:hypothetical protein
MMSSRDSYCASGNRDTYDRQTETDSHTDEQNRRGWERLRIGEQRNNFNIKQNFNLHKPLSEKAAGKFKGSPLNDTTFFTIAGLC